MKSNKKSIAVIGCGNMSGAVVRSIYRSNKEIEFLTYTPSKTRAVSLAQEVNGSVLESVKDVSNADMILVACKPQQFKSLASDLEGVDLSAKTIISIMAGISINQISSLLKSNRVIRLMPSIPMESDEGICLVHYRNQDLNDESRHLKSLLAPSSLVIELNDEEAFDRVTVVSASGPAYIYYFMSAMEKTLTDWGLEKDSVRPLVTQLFRGSAKNALESTSLSLEELIGKVTSKKGVTIEAIDSFRADRIESHINSGLEKAAKRSSFIRRELGDT